MFNVQRVVAHKRWNRAITEVELALYIPSNPLALCLTSQLRGGIPPLTPESSVSRLLNPNPVNHFYSSHVSVTIKVSPEGGVFEKYRAK